MIEQILPMILTVIVSFVAVTSPIKALSDIVKMFKSFKKDNDTKLKEINNQMKVVMSENYKLKKQINELLTKIDNVERK